MTLPHIWSSIRIAWEEGNAPTEAAIRNASTLLQVLGKPLPDWAGRGDWPTVCLHWSEAKVEVEVYDDVFQLCQFNPDTHVSVDVLDFDTTPEGVQALIKAMEFSDQLQPGQAGH